MYECCAIFILSSVIFLVWVILKRLDIAVVIDTRPYTSISLLRLENKKKKNGDSNPFIILFLVLLSNVKWNNKTNYFFLM